MYFPAKSSQLFFNFGNVWLLQHWFEHVEYVTHMCLLFRLSLLIFPYPRTCLVFFSHSVWKPRQAKSHCAQEQFCTLFKQYSLCDCFVSVTTKKINTYIQKNNTYCGYSVGVIWNCIFKPWFSWRSFAACSVFWSSNSSICRNVSVQRTEK